MGSSQTLQYLPVLSEPGANMLELFIVTSAVAMGYPACLSPTQLQGSFLYPSPTFLPSLVPLCMSINGEEVACKQTHWHFWFYSKMYSDWYMSHTLWLIQLHEAVYRQVEYITWKQKMKFLSLLNRRKRLKRQELTLEAFPFPFHIHHCMSYA